VPLGAARPSIANDALFSRVVAAAFGQRRKTLRNALANVADENALRAAGVDPSARGETLSIDDFARLANTLATTRGVGAY
jgi:16S rRNA (adenine1518-N6/adenine1519-N6)-dimethyltransferase